MTEVTGVYITIHKELAYELGNIIRMIFPQFPSELYWRTFKEAQNWCCLLYTSPSPRDRQKSRMPSSA